MIGIQWVSIGEIQVCHCVVVGAADKPPVLARRFIKLLQMISTSTSNVA